MSHNSLSSFWVRIPSNIDYVCEAGDSGVGRGLQQRVGGSTQSLVCWQSLRPSGGHIQPRLWLPGRSTESGELVKVESGLMDYAARVSTQHLRPGGAWHMLRQDDRLTLEERTAG